MDEGDGGRKGAADERAFVRLVARLDRNSVRILLRMARAMRRGEIEAADREMQDVLRTLDDAAARAGKDDPPTEG